MITKHLIENRLASFLCVLVWFVRKVHLKIILFKNIFYAENEIAVLIAFEENHF